MKNKIKNIIVNVIIFLTVFISVLMILATVYYKSHFAEQNFETLLYNTTNNLGTANLDVIMIGLKAYFYKLVFIFLLLYIPVFRKFKKKYYIDIKYKKRKLSWKIFPPRRCLYVIILLVISILFALIEIGFFEYVKEQQDVSTIFEDKYVDPQQVKISFPEEKRNLIYIFVESMETGLFSTEEGGGWDYTLVPELLDIAKENINFSNTELLGGPISTKGTTWTVAGMVANTAGIPLKLTNISSNEYAGYTSFLPGAYSLGDILKKQGYNLEIMLGSDASYGGRKEYFEEHGNYNIYDLNTAIEEGKMTEDDEVWWGFSDDDLFEWSKEEITKLSKDNKPFHYMMLTADTHFTDGYLSDKAEIKYEDQYENVFAYSSKCVSDFLKWIQEQDFYKNTTIVIVGDHIGMQTEFYKKNIKDPNYIRTVYNVIINSAVEEKNNKNRLFAAEDYFPTVLASIGAKIEGDRLGLGTNLFSGKKTLIEEIGLHEFNSELGKRSNFYNRYLLKDDYISMINLKEEPETE